MKFIFAEKSNQKFFDRIGNTNKLCCLASQIGRATGVKVVRFMQGRLPQNVRVHYAKTLCARIGKHKTPFVTLRNHFAELFGATAKSAVVKPYNL
jgi:hypothetical protein